MRSIHPPNFITKIGIVLEICSGRPDPTGDSIISPVFDGLIKNWPLPKWQQKQTNKKMHILNKHVTYTFPNKPLILHVCSVSLFEIPWTKGEIAPVSTEMFDWGFLYLLVGKVRVTKNEMEVQEFLMPILISSYIKMKHLWFFVKHSIGNRQRTCIGTFSQCTQWRFILII